MKLIMQKIEWAVNLVKDIIGTRILQIVEAAADNQDIYITHMYFPLKRQFCLSRLNYYKQ